MNLLGHVAVALAVVPGADDRVVLGSVLPDLAPLVGERLGPPTTDDPAVVRGIAVHRATDAVFHDDARFRAGSIALSRDLQARGVGRGASRAVGHAGWELLLDGVLVPDRTVTDAFDAAAALLGELAPAGSRLAELARRQVATPIWPGYADPATIAERLQRQLERRPLLAFDVDQLGEVTAGLEAARRGIDAIAAEVVADVTRWTAAALGAST